MKERTNNPFRRKKTAIFRWWLTSNLFCSKLWEEIFFGVREASKETLLHYPSPTISWHTYLDSVLARSNANFTRHLLASMKTSHSFGQTHCTKGKSNLGSHFCNSCTAHKETQSHLDLEEGDIAGFCSSSFSLWKLNQLEQGQPWLNDI